MLPVSMTIEEIKDGSITSTQGFLAGATCAGIKSARNALDLTILISEAPCRPATMFTTNKIKAAPVVLSMKHIKTGQTGAIVVNSGCANACTGKQGLKDAREVTEIVAAGLCLEPEQVLVASTGLIGATLPMKQVRDALDRIKIAAGGGHDFARAIMTTDTFAKEIAVSVRTEAGSFVIAGAAKGSGMIHPNLATLLCFLTTDAEVDASFLQRALKTAVERSLNMVTIDGDCSTNDCVFLLANGLAANEKIRSASPLAGVFQEALDRVCTGLAKSIARDGEGASRLIEVRLKGARTTGDARQGARTIAGSSLVKAAIHGNDPNWGRIVAALGRSGAEVRETRIELSLNGFTLMKKGEPQQFDASAVSKALSAPEVRIVVDLHLGKGEATAWGCDLSEEYVTINSDYST